MTQPENYAKYEADAVAEMAEILNGRTVANVRAMTADEAEEMYWDHRTLVIEFDDGTRIFASSDDEGNSAGALFVTLPDGTETGCGVFRYTRITGQS